MTVFKTILKILYKLKGMLILYTVLLIAITLLNQNSNNAIVGFEETKPAILVVNKDDTNNKITNNFVEYINKHSDMQDQKIDINNEDAINDGIFYRKISYVVYIPENFGKDLLEGKNPTVEYKSNGDEYSSYSEMLVEKYIKTALVYSENYNEDEIIEKINEIMDIDTNIDVHSTLNTSKLNSMTRYFNFLNYAFLAGCVYCISMLLASLKEKNVRKRTIISSFNYKKYNRIVLLSNAIVIFAMWLLYMGLSFILFKDLMLTQNGLAFGLNSLVFAFCCLCIGFFVGTITQNKSAIGGIVNVIALGTSFLCGCFVPVEYMPEYVVKISQIFPSYYFAQNNEMIRTMEVFNIEKLQPVLINGGIIIAFSLVFIILTNYVSKRKQILS